jgi:4-hydroxy-3-methylbut-2-enyl diphosphate reductase
VGVTAGAAAPAGLVQGRIHRRAQRVEVTVVEGDAARETVTFKLPRALAE